MAFGKPPADAILPERAPALWVPLRFMLAGLLFLALLLVVLAVRAPMIATTYLHNPITLSATHLFTLGFAGSVATGALYQMIPVLLHSRLASERMVNLHLALHALGVLGMATGFYQSRATIVISGGLLVITGVCFMAWNLGKTLRAAERWNWHGSLIGAALLFYILTLSWGLVLAFNQRWGFLSRVGSVAIPVHLTLGLGGWFSLLIFAVGLKLVPMFSPARPLPGWVVATIGGAAAAGVSLTVTTLLLGGRAIVGPLLMAAAALAYAGALGYTHLRRRNSPLDFSVRFSLTAAAGLSLIVLAGLLALAGLPLAEGTREGLVWGFALAWIGGTIMGMLLRIIPFMIWLNRFRHRESRNERIPFLKEMFDPRFGTGAYVGWFLGAAAVALGSALDSPLTITGGGLLCLAGLGSHAAAIVQMLHHVRPGTPVERG